MALVLNTDGESVTALGESSAPATPAPVELTPSYSAGAYEPSPPPRRMQPATKLAILFLLGCVLLFGIFGAMLYHSTHPTDVPSDNKAGGRESAVSASPGRAPQGSALAFDAAADFFSSWTFLILLVLFCPILYLVSAVLLLAWVAKDAKNRGIDGGAVWVIVLFFTHWIGLLVYLASRPSGFLVVCDRCHNKKLNYVLSCPHCGGGVS
jgi:hypothetical protein